MSIRRPAAAIFDMDGLLIDSEPFWRRAEQEVFAAVGLRLDDAMCALTMGRRVDEVVAFWFDRRPWSEERPEHRRPALAERIVERVGELVASEGEALPGGRELPREARRRGLRVGLASSSPAPLIDAVLSRLGLEDCFEVRCSALDDARGKPAPDVYLRAARELGVAPASALAFEDSVAGVRSARAAGMSVVAVPAPEQRSDPGFADADEVHTSLLDVDLERWLRR